MNNLQEGVQDYVNVLAKKSASVAGANPNSETSLLNKELIEFYKNNTLKAQSVINSAPAGVYASPEHRMHVQAANIAINGYNAPAPVVMSAPSINNSETELDKLRRAGWKPLNEQKSSELLLG